MSITSITFNILNYYPTSFNFHGYIFQILSDDTNFSNFISYDEKNSVKDKFEGKKEIKYYIKGLLEGELIGVTFLTIPNKHFYKKTKSLIFDKLKLTINDFVKKKIFTKDEIENNNSISLKIKLTFTYTQKHLCFKKKPIKKIPKLGQSFKTLNNSTISTSKKNRSPYCSPQMSNRSSFIHYRKPSETSFCSSKKKKCLSNYQSLNVSLNENSSDSDVSAIDSALIDNEEEKENENEELDLLRTRLSFVTLDNILPSDNELREKSSLMQKKLNDIQNECVEKIEDLVHTNIKVMNSVKSSGDKLRGLNKKNDKLIEGKERFNLVYDMTCKYNRVCNNAIAQLTKIKQMEEKELNFIFKDYHEKIVLENSNINQEEKENNKKLLLKAIKGVLDLNLNITSCFNKDGIAKFKYICEKYKLIDGFKSRSIKEEEYEGGSQE